MEQITIPELNTDRLLLRGFERSDVHTVRTLAGAFEIADTTLNVPHPYEAGMAEVWMRTHADIFRTGAGVNFAIVHRSDGCLLGSISLRGVHKTFHHAELGYWIAVPYWGKGYASEAGRAVLNYGFTDMSLHRIYAHYLARNPASGRVMEKIGMRREGLLRQHVVKWGKYEDIVLYGAVKADLHSDANMRLTV